MILNLIIYEIMSIKFKINFFGEFKYIVLLYVRPTHHMDSLSKCTLKDWVDNLIL